MNPLAQQDIHAETEVPSTAIAARLISKINSHPRMKMISVGALDSADKLDGTIYVDEKLFKVRIQILPGTGDSSTANYRYASVFTILCGLDPAGGQNFGTYWQYVLAHPYSSYEYVTTVINKQTGQEQHIDTIKSTSTATFRVTQRPAVCHDVTFIGYVDL